MEGSSLLETGVDKLVSLVRKNKRISVADAAKQLGVSTVVVEEWADFLEEEGIISVEYKFTTPYLVERLLTREEIEKKRTEFGGKKEAFVRKAEVTLALLDKEGSTFQKIKEQFDDLKKNLAVEIKNVKGDLRELEKYEELKNQLESQILEQQTEFKSRVRQIENHMLRDEKKYSEILQKIGEEEKKLDKEKMMALSIRERENLLRERLDSFRKMIEKLENSIESEDKLVVDSEEHIASLKNISEELKENVEAKKSALDEIFAESKEKEKKIEGLQESILAKTKEKKAEIEKRIAEGKGASAEFRDFFDKKANIEGMIRKISDDRNELEKELIRLIHQARAFSIAAKSKNIKSQMGDLKKTFTQIDRKKSRFEKELRKLVSIFKK